MAFSRPIDPDDSRDERSIAHSSALRAHVGARAAHIDRLRRLLALAPATKLALAPQSGLVDGIGTENRPTWSHLRRAAFVAADPQALSPADRLILMALALDHSSSRRLVFAQDTAGAVWDLPTIGRCAELVEFATPSGVRGRSPQARRRRSTIAPQATEVGDLLVTDLNQTLIDGARYRELDCAVARCDAAVHLGLTDTGSLLDAVGQLPTGARGCRMAELAVLLADGRSESPLESLSRCRMFQAQLPRPELQVKFRDAEGDIGRVDFYWPELGIVGESDGRSKYAVASAMTGAQAGQVLWKEKRREDRLRRHPDVHDVIRWGWQDALPLPRFIAMMHGAGIHPVRDIDWPVPDRPLPRKSRHVSVTERHRT